MIFLHFRLAIARHGRILVQSVMMPITDLACCGIGISQVLVYTAYKLSPMGDASPMSRSLSPPWGPSSLVAQAALIPWRIFRNLAPMSQYDGRRVSKTSPSALSRELGPYSQSRQICRHSV